MSFYTDHNSSNVRMAASITTTALAVGTIGTAIATAAVTSTVTTIALAALTCLGAAISIAAMLAWRDDKSTTVNKYFNNIGHHSAVTIPATLQFVSMHLVNAIVRAVSDSLYTNIRKKFG